MPALAPPSDDERTLLLAYVAQQRLALKAAAFGLTEAQARQPIGRSNLCIGGLVKHVTSMERSWMTDVTGGARDVDESSYGDEFRMTDDETLAGLVADLDRCAAQTEAIVAGLPLDHPVPVPPAPWFPKDVTSWSLRWVLLHLIEEIARHAGHADQVREAIDGATMYPLLAGLEGWPATEWLQPWAPPPA